MPLSARAPPRPSRETHGHHRTSPHAASTGRDLHTRVRVLAARADRTLGSCHIGRLTAPPEPAPIPGRPPTPGRGPTSGQGPYARTSRPDTLIGPDNALPLRRVLDDGRPAHWILRIRLVDEYRGHAAVHTGLLDLV
ncbi:hypothetical protein [Streptomyces sp. NPDC097619]|uniref:hypothetical protein n=1 Tax=Streptomyces sp. NPDC097619 TaxID=3157228 RepID=UPI0033243D7E